MLHPQTEILLERRSKPFIRDVSGLIRGRVLFHVVMRDITSLKIGGRADILAYPLDEEDLLCLLRYAKRRGMPYYIIGKCTNLLVKDEGIRGMVIDLSKGFNRINDVDNHGIIAESGVPLKKIVNFCAEKGFEGLEFACGIPGSLGGAITMNAGAYDGEIKDVVEEIDVMGEDGVVRKIKRDCMNFRYRELELNGIIIRAFLRLKQGDTQRIKEKIDSYKRARQTTQSISFPNAGSIFKNPEGISAGKLIEELGLKGQRVGDASISDVHGNYIVNVGNASSRDVLNLIAIVKQKALKERNISLETEIRCIGED